MLADDSPLFFSIFFRNTALGKLFFKAVATPDSVKNILCQVSNSNN